MFFVIASPLQRKRSPTYSRLLHSWLPLVRAGIQMTSSVDSTISCKLHCKDRPNFFIPGITGRARCLSESSIKTQGKPQPTNLAGTNILIDLARFREQKERSSSRSAPERLTSPTASSAGLVDEDAGDGFDANIDAAQALHDHILGKIKEARNKKAMEGRKILDAYLLSKSNSLMDVSPLRHDDPPKQEKSKTKKTSREAPISPMVDKSISRRSRSPKPSPRASNVNLFDISCHSADYARSLEAASLYPLSPSQKPRNSFLPQHLLSPQQTKSCFQPFGADDVLPGFSDLPPPPPLLEIEKPKKSKKAKSSKRISKRSSKEVVPS